jgi:hypothetical protein
MRAMPLPSIRTARRYRSFTLACAFLVVAGCAANSRIQVREVEQEVTVVSAAPFRRIAVIAVDRNPAARRAWEDAFATRLGGTGTTVTKGDGLPGAATNDADAVAVDGRSVIEAARAAGADAILYVRPPNAVPMRARDGARRFLDARSGPEVRMSEFDDSPTAVAELRLFQITTDSHVWRALVTIQYPPASGVPPGGVADAAVSAMQRRGLVRAAPG